MQHTDNEYDVGAENQGTVTGSVSLEALPYANWFKRHGVRLTGHLVTPVLSDTSALELPRDAIYHYVSTGPSDVGPNNDDPLFSKINRPIPMWHQTNLMSFLGSPRKLVVQVDPIIRRYHMQNRRYRRITEPSKDNIDPNVPIIVNYATIDDGYTYIKNQYGPYYAHQNNLITVWKTIGILAAKSDRQHFIRVVAPKILPSVQELSIATRGITLQGLKLFNNPESLFVLEFWKWLGIERSDSAIAAVADEDLGKINLIFEDKGHWSVVNLGVFNSWRKASEEELRNNPEGSDKGFDPKVAQRRFLYFMMRISETDETLVGIPQTTNGIEVPVAEKSTAKLGVPVVELKDGKRTGNTTIAQPAVGFVDDGGIEEADEIVIDPEVEKHIERDLGELDRLIRNLNESTNTPSAAEMEAIQDVEKTPEEGVMSVCNQLADAGRLTAAEYRRFDELSKAYRKLPAPNGKGTLAEHINVTSEDLKITGPTKIVDIPTVVDKTMLETTLLDFDARYNRDILPRHVSAMVVSLQNAGIAIGDYKVETVEEITGSYETHTVTAIPVEGQRSTLRFKMPVISEEGIYVSNGVKYRMRKQRVDVPIRKISPSTVQLSSYYGKTFVDRSDKKVNDYGEWLRNQIMIKGLDESDTSVTALNPTSCYDNLFKSPRLYSTLAQGFTSFALAGFKWYLNHKDREKLFGADVLKAYEKNGVIVAGIKEAGPEYLLIDSQNNLFAVKPGAQPTPLPKIESMLELSLLKAPVDFATLKVSGKTIPLAVVLGHEIGLSKLMALLGVTPRRVIAGGRLNLTENEYLISFADETLVFSRSDAKAALILAGFNEYHRHLRSYSVYDFDKRAVYGSLLEDAQIGIRRLRELNLMYQMFIDPITKQILTEMKEPTTFRGLLMRSVDLLMTDYHPDTLDLQYQLIRGNERMAGAVYAEMVQALRTHNGRAGKANQRIDLHPYAVWKRINQDPSISLVQELNPVENVKEQEAVTFGGVGGRNSRALTKNLRAYHPNDMGTISEATKDSADVAINTYLSANPQFTSLLGTTSRYDMEGKNPTNLLSTSALLSVAADRDDTKRVGFISIQNGHAIACGGYTQAAVRTGYEQVLPHRTGDLFAVTAKQNGKVVSLTGTGIVIEYEDGQRKGIELGRRYGNAEGLVVPHTVVSPLKEGDQFKVGDPIAYNTGFFEPDILNPRQIVWKNSTLARTALMESSSTLEDSSVISKRLSEKLSTQRTLVRTIVVNFDQSVRRAVKAGTELEYEDILCYIEDAVSASNNLIDEESLDTLRAISASTPQAKIRGTVERVEVYYHGDLEDMSESLRQMAVASDKEIAKRNLSIGKRPFTGSVDEGFRVDGNPLELDTVAIRFYISASVGAGVGDKGVFCNQMKTVFGEVMPDTVVTENGEPVDAIFGMISIYARIVDSPALIGTTTTLLGVISRTMADIYDGD